jgi:hypothetical protein
MFPHQNPVYTHPSLNTFHLPHLSHSSLLITQINHEPPHCAISSSPVTTALLGPNTFPSTLLTNYHRYKKNLY